jgi:hypothetical protein
MTKETEFIHKNKLLDKMEEQMKCTFQPDTKRLSSENYRSNTKITGNFYERSVTWKDAHEQWIEDSQKEK